MENSVEEEDRKIQNLEKLKMLTEQLEEKKEFASGRIGQEAGRKK